MPAKRKKKTESTKRPSKKANKASTKKAPAKKASTKKSPAKKASTKKTPAKKTSSKKTSSKKTPAKKTSSKKTPAKKTSSKKTPAKKTSSKKTPTKKTSSKKTPAKKTSSTKTPAKKTSTKKTSSKKTPAKKTSSKKTTPAKKKSSKKTTKKDGQAFDKKQYNQIADDYKESKKIDFRVQAEQYSLFQALGDVKGKSVMDLACGEGHYTRLIARQLKPAEMLAVDISDEMIKLGQKQEKAEKLGVEYLNKDVLYMGKVGEFDVITAIYLLNYAADRLQLHQMVHSIWTNLAPGGRFISITDNPDQPTERYKDDVKYGFVKSMKVNTKRRKEGDKITWSYPSLPDLHFDSFFLPLEAYKEAFEAVGFRDFTCDNWSVAPEAVSAKGIAYWKDLVKPNASMMVMKASRPLDADGGKPFWSDFKSYNSPEFKRKR